jgi:hypothetical protein
MDSIVKLRVIKTGHVQEFTFEHALNILILDNNNDFECADNKHQFIDNELIKRPSDKGSEKPTKPKGGKRGKKVSKPIEDINGSI